MGAMTDATPPSAPTWTVHGPRAFRLSDRAVRAQWWTSPRAPGADAVPGGIVLREEGGSCLVSGIVTMIVGASRPLAVALEADPSSYAGEDGWSHTARVVAATPGDAAPILEREAASPSDST